MMTFRSDRGCPGAPHGSNRLKPIRPTVARALVSFPYLSRLRQRKWMIRRGQSRKPIFSRFCSVGGPHRPPTLTTLDARDGAYRHRASKQEKRRCGGSGFILGGIDGDCGLHWQTQCVESVRKGQLPCLAALPASFIAHAGRLG